MTTPTPTVTTVESGPRAVSRRVVVPAPAAQLFALAADPHRHPELDGSGTVRDAPVTGPHDLVEGARFTVAMKQYGVPYKITSTVTRLEPVVDGRGVVEWRHPAGHRWRWEFEALGDDSTAVTETFDYADAKAPRLLEILGQPAKNASGITATLQGLALRYS